MEKIIDQSKNWELTLEIRRLSEKESALITNKKIRDDRFIYISCKWNGKERRNVSSTKCSKINSNPLIIIDTIDNPVNSFCLLRHVLFEVSSSYYYPLVFQFVLFSKIKMVSNNN